MFDSDSFPTSIRQMLQIEVFVPTISNNRFERLYFISWDQLYLYESAIVYLRVLGK